MALSKNLFIAISAVGVLLFMSNQNLPLGIRNNNAGNIRASGGWRDWIGAVDENKGFIVFDTAENGLRAMARTLRTYRLGYGLKTIRQIITRWAPPNENDTESYIKSASSATGIPADRDLDVSEYPALMAAIVHHENGLQPYTEEQLVTGFERGFA